jgi:hypothetical protein
MQATVYSYRASSGFSPFDAMSFKEAYWHRAERLRTAPLIQRQTPRQQPYRPIPDDDGGCPPFSIIPMI